MVVLEVEVFEEDIVMVSWLLLVKNCRGSMVCLQTGRPGNGDPCEGKTLFTCQLYLFCDRVSLHIIVHWLPGDG